MLSEFASVGFVLTADTCYPGQPKPKSEVMEASVEKKHFLAPSYQGPFPVLGGLESVKL